MTARPADWSPLCEADPIPGDPDGVEELAGRYQKTAKAIADAAAGLRKIAGDEGWKSDAGDAFREQAVDVAKEVSKAERRYREAGRALATYAGALRAAQRRADAALRRARDAASDLATSGGSTQGPQQPQPAGPPAQPSPAEQQRQRAAQNARSAIAAEQAEVGRAIADRNAAADAAAAKIEDVAKHDGLKDDFWDDIAPALKVIADFAGVIATLCGILSLLVGWIPVIGQALAGVLGTIALIASIVALVCHLTLYLSGHGSGKDVLMDVISVASFGIGRLFTAGSKLSAVAARVKAWRGAPRNTGTPLRELIGGRLANPGRRVLSQTPRNLGDVRFSGLLPGALRRSFAADWKVVSENLHVLKTNPFKLAGQTFGDAYRANGIQGVANTLWGNTDLARDLAQLGRMSPSVITTDVAALVSRSHGMNAIGLTGQLTGSLTDGYSAVNSVMDAFGGPDVTAAYARPAAAR